MMVKKFNEFVEEGFMTKSVDRNKSNKQRLQNKITEKDLKVFDKFECVSNFNSYIKKYDLLELCQNFLDTVFEKYESEVVNYIKKNGFNDWYSFKFDEIETTFDDFDFKIEHSLNGSPLVFHFNIAGETKNLTTHCGSPQNPDEFDITESEFSSGLYAHCLDNIIEMIITENDDLITKNIEMNWDEFSEELSDFMYNDFSNYFDEIGDLSMDEITFSSFEGIDEFNEKFVDHWLLNSIDCGTKTILVGFDDNEHFDISNTPLAKKIFEIIESVYEKVKNEYEEYEE